MRKSAVKMTEEIELGREKKQRLIDTAVGRRKADLVLKNAAYVNVFSKELLHGDIACTDGMIAGIGSYGGEDEVDMSGKVVCPGFIDAHIHLESSLVTPYEFAKSAVTHGTSCVIADPHEIANVMGADGIDYMLQASGNLPIDVYYMLPSCVPATPLDENGAALDLDDIEKYIGDPRVLGLAEMMNAFGVVHCEKDPLQKIAAAAAFHKNTDGHAPGLSGKELNAYIATGVRSEHECTAYDEALEKLRLGQYIMIREGTAARNLDTLIGLLAAGYDDRCMFCTDDLHPNVLLENGHIDCLIRRAVRDHGIGPITAIRAASYSAARYFRLDDRGAIAPGYVADMVVLDGLDSLNIERVYTHGVCRFGEGAAVRFAKPEIDAALLRKARDTFHMHTVTAADFENNEKKPVIGMVPGQVLTVNDGFADRIDTEKDILRIAVVERHHGTGHIGLGYLHGYGMREGAAATSVAHDSHNIVAIGANVEDIAFAVNRVAENRGGLVVVKDGRVSAEVPLEIAGLMSDTSAAELNGKLENAKAAARRQGVSSGIDPFMTLSFMSLSVIPELKLTTRGMIDAVTQKLC